LVFPRRRFARFLKRKGRCLLLLRLLLLLLLLLLRL
jgi:hypothetical protein